MRGEVREGVEGASAQLSRGGSGAESAAVIEWRGVARAQEDPFRSFAGGDGLRMALAAKIIRAHGGEVSHDAGVIRARLLLLK